MYLKATVMVLIISLLACGPAYCDVVWSDEFNGDSIDSGVWTYDVSGEGFGNGQLEYDTARQENSYIENGNLVIEARREDYMGNSFTSARMLTQGRFAFKYGSLEARIKVPDTADGLWPAFWMLGNNFPAIGWPMAGEVDILEIGGKAGIAEGLQRRKINCALHFSNSAGQKGIHDAWHDADVDLNLDYHLYKISWTPEYMKFYLDGVEFGSWDITADHLREFHQPFFLILNLAVGGWDSSYTGVYSPKAVTASFPAKMYVDWIRLSGNPHTKVYLGKDFEESGNFGVFTETTRVKNSLIFEDGSDPEFNYGRAAAVYPWNNMTEAESAKASEGDECWSFDIAGGNWFGMGVFLPNFRNMKNYSDGHLNFDIKTTSSVAMKVGIKSSRGGDFFVPLGDETVEFGFARDGQWHSVSIPLNRCANIDFHTVHQMFMIAGDSPSAAFNLSIDNVWWAPSGARPSPKQGNFGVYTETAAAHSQRNVSLCSAYKGRFNLAVGLDGRLPDDYSAKELNLIRTQFNVLTPANCMKMYHIQRREGIFDFEQADAFVSFAAANRQKVLGHCLIWAKDVRTPGWFFEKGGNLPTRELLLKRMQKHIETVVARYRGKVAYWDVVNEALADDEHFIRPSSYLSVIGDDFIAKAFEYAHAADPEAMLIYNDYNLFFANKQKKLKQLLEYFRDRKVPVGAIGIQGHFELDRIPYADLEATINLIKSFGLKMVVSELDIDVVLRSKWWADGGKGRDELAKYDPYKGVCPAEILEYQAREYGKLFALFSRHAESIERITFWGLHDGQSWLNNFPWKRTNHPLLFDRNAEPKPAYDAVLSIR